MNKQNLIACLLLSAYTIHSAIDAGMFIPLTIISSSSSAGGGGGADVHFFPGGTFVYKFMTKDYFASHGTLRAIVSDLVALSSVENETTVVREGQLPRDDDDSLYDDRMYTIYMDDATLIPGGKTRFASGILLPTETNDSSSSSSAAHAVMLPSMNERIATAAAEHAMKNGIGGGPTMSNNVQYQIGTLPKEVAVVATHRFTGGVWSALLQTYKIIPKLKTYYQEYSSSSSSSSADGGEEEERNLIVITKCSVSRKICTYYVPLYNVTLFYMNHITTEEYVKEFSSSHDDDDWMLTRMGNDLGNMFNQLKNTILGDGKELSSSLLTSTTPESLGLGNGSSSEL